MGLFSAWSRRKEAQREDLRVNQELLHSTIDHLHAMLTDRDAELEQVKAEVVELSMALRECDHERLRLRVRLQSSRDVEESG